MTDFDGLMYNWHYGVLPRIAKLAFTPAQICIVKDFVVVLDSGYENLFIFSRGSMQFQSQIGTGICDMPVHIFPVSENDANMMVLVSDSLVQMLNLDSIHMENVNSVFEFTFVELKSREGSIASLWSDRNTASYLVLWLGLRDSPLIYELFDDNSPKIVFDRIEWVSADRLLLMRAASVPVCFSVFSLAARRFLNHVVMNIGCGPQHFAISSGNRRLALCQDGSFIIYDTASLKRILCCDCDLASEAIDFMALFQNNFMSVGLLSDHRVVRYYINEEYCSVDRVSEGQLGFESYDRFRSAHAIGDEVLVVRCSSRDRRSTVLGLLNHFDGNVFQFLKLRLGDQLSLSNSCLVTFSKKAAADRHFELALFDFTATAAPEDLWPRLKQKMAEMRKDKKNQQDYVLSKQRHVQQLMRAKMLELNRNHMLELKRIAKIPVYVSKASVQDVQPALLPSSSQQDLDQQQQQQQQQPQPQISAKTGEGDLKDAVVASKSSSSSVQCTLMKLVDTGAELTGPKADYSGSLLQKQQRQQKREQQRQESGESFFDQCEHRKQQQQQQQQQQDSQEPERKSGSEEAESEQPDSAAELNRLRSIIAELKGQLSVCQPNALELRQRRRQQSPRRRNVGLLVKPSCRDVGVNFVAESAKPIQRSVGVSVSLEAPVRGALNDGGGVEHIADSRSTSQDEDFATKSSPPPPPSPPPTPPPSPPQAIASHRQAAQNIIQQLQHTYGISTLELVNLVGQLRDVTNCGMQVSPDSRSIGTDSSAADAGCGECESPVRSHHHSGDEEKFEPSDGAFIPVEKSIALNCASLSIDKKNASNDSAKAQSRPTKRVRFHSPEAVRCLYNADDSSSSSQATEESAAEASTESSQEAYEPQESVVRACGTFVAWCKDSTGMSAAQLNDSLATIKQEWFRISSGPDTRLDQVTSFLQYLGHQGPQLLDKVVNMVDDNGNTGLHYAVSHRNWPLVNALLATGMARTDLYNRAGYSALILVGIHRLPPPPSPPTSTATVASAADADAAAAADDDDNNENNKDAMLEARRIARHLMLSGDVNARAVNSGRTALMLAASHGRTETLRLLLEVGALPNLQDDNGFTALMIAAQQGHLDCVRALLAHPGIDTQIQGKNGATALTVAMKNSHQEAALLVYAKNKLAGRSGLSLPVEKQNGRTHSRKAIPGSNR